MINGLETRQRVGKNYEMYVRFSANDTECITNGDKLGGKNAGTIGYSLGC